MLGLDVVTGLNGGAPENIQHVKRGSRLAQEASYPDSCTASKPKQRSNRRPSACARFLPRSHVPKFQARFGLLVTQALELF